MTMIVSNRQRIFYRFEGEKGAFLLLHHGLFGSHRDWYEAGYVDELAGDFRLIIPDARGHGRSDRPLESSQYGLSALADDMVALMDDLSIRNLHFFGYSLGALVGFEMLMRHPERMRISMLCGEAPFVTGRALEEWRGWVERLRAGSLADFMNGLRAERLVVSRDTHPPDESDRESVLALLEALSALEPRPRGRITVDSPVALFTAENDPAAERIREARRSINRARLVALPNMDHAGAFRQRDALLEQMLRLLKSGKRQNGSSNDKPVSAGARHTGRARAATRPGEEEAAGSRSEPPPGAVEDTGEPESGDVREAAPGSSPDEARNGAYGADPEIDARNEAEQPPELRREEPAGGPSPDESAPGGDDPP